MPHGDLGASMGPGISDDALKTSTTRPVAHAGDPDDIQGILQQLGVGTRSRETTGPSLSKQKQYHMHMTFQTEKCLRRNQLKSLVQNHPRMMILRMNRQL